MVYLGLSYKAFCHLDLLQLSFVGYLIEKAETKVLPSVLSVYDDYLKLTVAFCRTTCGAPDLGGSSPSLLLLLLAALQIILPLCVVR